MASFRAEYHRYSRSDDDWHSNLFRNRTHTLNPVPHFRFGEIKNKHESQAEIFI